MKTNRVFGHKRLRLLRWSLRLALLLMAICPSIGPLPTFAQTGLTIEAIVLHNANLRAGPGITYPVIGSATVSQLVTVTDDAGAWYQLVTGEWIAKHLVAATPASRVVAFRLEDALARANRRANLRNGPGTSYAIVGQVQAGQHLQIVGQNQVGEWFKLHDGPWIAAFLVNRSEVGLPIVEVPAELANTTEVTAMPADEQPAGK